MKVSIVIPIYNVSSYLRNCLDSCINQSYKDLEIICVDDGSTDNSGHIANEYSLLDERIKVVHKANGGLPSARKAGIELASGKYIFHLDGDDDMPLNAIESLIEISDNGVHDIVIGNYYQCTDNIGSIDAELMDVSFKKKLSGEEYLNKILTTGRFNIWGKLYKRKLYIENDIRIPLNISMGEDLIEVTQLAFFAESVVSWIQPVYNYYIRPKSMSKANNNVVGELCDRSIYAVEFITKVFENIVPENTRGLLVDYVKMFIIQYLMSPYSVSLRKNELEHLVNFLKKAGIRGRTKNDLICRIASINLPFAEFLVKSFNKLKRR